MMWKLWLPAYCVFCFLNIASAQPVSDDLPIVTNCIALVNAKLISAPGKPAQVSTVVIRDGLITHVGSDIKIPADAYRIASDSFYVYPAFIDAFSSIGIKEQEETPPAGQGPGGRAQRPPVDPEGHPTLEDAGITPFRSVRSVIDAKEKSISDWRAQGFAISHAVPRGKMIPGKGALLILTGKDVDQLIWKEDFSMYSQWVGAGGSYPSTVIGLFAKWRELYANASNNVVHQTSYETGSLVSRPHYNQAHEALMPVVKKSMPLYFRAPKVKDISRALSLQADLGMKMVIADAEEAYFLKSHFKQGTVPLVLSLDLPEDKSEAKKEKEKEEKEKPSSVPAPDSIKTIAGEKPVTVDSTKTIEEKKIITADSTKKTGEKKPVPDPEKEAFEKRRTESLKEHRAQAAILAKEGIPFSFGTMSVKPADFHKNLELMIEQGLSHDQALSALTVQPSRLLGIEKYSGTIEAGKMANVIVSNKPIFEKEASIRYMIVEGNLYEYEVKEKKKTSGTGDKSSGEPAVALTGTWTYSIDTPDQKREGTMEFTEEGGEITGTIKGSDFTSGNSELEDIVLEGNSVSFTFDFDMNGQLMRLEFDLSLKGESFDGNVTAGEFGTFPVSGQRISKPE